MTAPHISRPHVRLETSTPIRPVLDPALLELRPVRRKRSRTPVEIPRAPRLLAALTLTLWIALLSGLVVTGPSALAAVAAAAAPERTGTAGPASATGASGTTVRRYSLTQLGALESLKFSGADHSIDLPLSVRLDETVVSARLKLAYTFSPSLLPEVSQLRVTVNDEPVGTIAATRGRLGSPQSAELQVDPNLFTEFAKLRLQFIGHYASECENPQHSSLWAQISPTSTLEVVTRPLALSQDLALLPAPFFDRRDATALKLPFVFPAKSNLDTVFAAGTVASWFGALADYRPVHFPTLVDRLPDRHAVVLATNDDRPAGLTLPRVETPTIAVVAHPRLPAVQLLVLLGKNGEQLRAAAQALVLGQATLSGSQVQVKNVVQPAPRKAWDSPRVIGPGRSVRAADLVDNPAQLQVRGRYLAPITLQWRLPPDRLNWPLTGVPVQLRYRFTPPREGAGQLSVHLNGHFVQSFVLHGSTGGDNDSGRLLPFLESAGAAASQRLFLPSHFLAPHNKLEFVFQFPATEDTQCRQTSLGAQASIDADSTLDFDSMDLYAQMPNLAHFANAGFPFTKYPDLAQSALVLPERWQPADVEAALTILGRFGAASGLPATRWQLVTASQVSKVKDRDLLVLTGEDRDGLLKTWADRLPATPGGEIQAASALDRIQQGTARWFSPQTGTQPVGWVQWQQQSMPGILGFESPLEPARSVVLIAGGDATSRLRLIDAMQDPVQLARFQGDLALLRGEAVESFQLGSTYHVGDLPWWRRLWFHLHNRALPLLGAALVAGLLAALAIHQWMRQRAARRLQAG